jgi:hypothetical protein
MPGGPTRRTALRLGLLAAGVAGLGACGIRLEDDAPQVPLIPRRRPVPGEDFLIGLWLGSGDLATQARSLGGAPTSLPARLAVIHTDQAEVLHAELQRLGVPQEVLDEASSKHTSTTSASGSTTATGTTGSSGSATSPRSSATAPGGVLALAAAEGSAVDAAALHGAAGLPSAQVPLAGSVLAQRAAAAALLGAPVAAPEPSWKEPSLAASFLETTRSAVYAFQVVAAQSPSGAQATLARTTLAALVSRERTQETLAGDAGGAPALGYPLPFPVTTPAAARRLAVSVLTELRAALARDLGSAERDVEAFGSVVDWLSTTEVSASRWGVRLAPFPGLQ